jgi:outer membrane protein TolC
VLLGTIPEAIKTTIKDHAPPVATKPITKNSSFVQLSNEVQIPSNIPTIVLDTATPINAGDLLNRPDLRIAQLQAIAKNSQIGVAKADLYPHFTLVGSIGFNANNANGSWTTPANALTVGIGPSISWNPFYADFYQNQVRIADAQFQESLLNYNQHILKAVQEVSNATQGYLLTSQQYELNKQAIHASRRAFNLSSIQYDNGMVTYQRLLNTMESLTRSEDNIAITRGNIALHAISLYKALGGGLKISDGKPLLHPDTVKSMSQRTDWGNLLDTNQTTHPKVKP